MTTKITGLLNRITTPLKNLAPPKPAPAPAKPLAANLSKILSALPKAAETVKKGVTEFLQGKAAVPGSPDRARTLQTVVAQTRGVPLPPKPAPPSPVLQKIATSVPPRPIPGSTPTTAFQALANIRNNFQPGNWAALVPRYGNFGGPGWTGGVDTNVSGTPGGSKQPIDIQDQAYQKHDRLYSEARQHPDPAEQARLRDRADQILIQDLQKIPFGSAKTVYGEVFRVGATAAFTAKHAVYEAKQAVTSFGNSVASAFNGFRSLFAV